MIITKTPFRISFFGGGTDYPLWFRQHGGAVLATAIDKYCYISCRKLPPFFEHKHRLVYSKVECINNVSEIQHPAVRAILGEYEGTDGLEIHHDADLPARSGLGSSSSFTVGMLNALAAHQGRLVSKYELAEKAIHLEQNVMKETVGSQDQITAAYGGFNKVVFNQDDSFTVSPLTIHMQRREQLSDSLVLLFTGFTRFATDIASTQVKNFNDRTKELTTMRQMVDEAISILQTPERNIDEFGKLLNESWKLKKSLSDAVSTSFIDEAYETGMRAGALGGKLLGAGGGGFLLFYVKPENRQKLLAALNKLLHVEFNFDYSGSSIALYDPKLS